MEKQPKRILVGVRIVASDLAELKRIGQLAKPVPVNQSAMIGVAIREYVERHGGKAPKK